MKIGIIKTRVRGDQALEGRCQYMFSSGPLRFGSSWGDTSRAVDELQLDREAERSSRTQKATDTLHEQQPGQGLGRVPTTE